MSSEKKDIQPSLGPGGRGPGPFHGKKEKASDVKSTLRRLWGYLRAQRAGLVLVFFIVIVTSLLNTAGPWLMKVAIDSCLSGSVDFPALAKLLALMGLIFFGASALTLLQQWIMASVSQKVVYQLRKEIFAKFQTLTIRYFDTRSTGEMMSRVTNDIDNISNTIAVSVLEILSALFTILSVGAVMLIINWQLALICLCTIPLLILLTKKIAGSTRKGFRDRQRYLGELNGMIEESISGHQVIRSYTKEEALLRSFTETNEQLRKASNKANITSGLMGPLMNMMNNLNYAVTAFAGGVMALYGMVSVGTIAAFLNYSRQFSRPLNQVAQLYTMIQSAIAGAERVFTVLDETPEFDDSPDALPLDEVKGHVEFKDVHFRYVEDIPVLKGIDLEAKPGQTIALVGPTGAGKTTIINLLTRFYDYHRGEISIDGLEIRTLKKNDLRRNLGIVLQDSFLFTGTIRENIRF
ncbi:MAG: ABC transporter ATP-binding protein, partial [Spirochaetales bacterium]|nr:ABC transporter ATP-binding protein [Spirochaetales bacterium]